MKTALALLASCLMVTASPAFGKKASGGTGGSHSVNGHVTKKGTYVAPHQRTNPNSTQRDNWSSKPNTNPYTGKPGHKEPQQ